MSMDLVTAVIATYNYGRFVTQAVESVLAQTYGNLEVIVVDDGSDDDTRELLAPYTDRIRYIYQKNQSVAAARNTGIRAASGDLIAFLDADDIWHPQKIEVQMRYLADHPEVGLVAVERLPEGIATWPPLDGLPNPQARPVTVEALVLRPLFAPSGVLMRKQCFDVVGYFDTNLRNAEDYDMWIRIACRFPIVKLEVPLWWYRVHGANKSHVPARQEAAALKVLEKNFARSGPLGHRFFLKEKAYSYAVYAAALNYSAVGKEFLTLARLLQSFLRWPIPYHRDEVTTWLARPKKLIVSLLRVFHLMQRTYPQISPQAPSPTQPVPHCQPVHEATERA
ncbi:MAG TPA: glycosyltransferase [Gemmataceae bacterium]|nr:glycosyltransferase [Gemmataceae bacterium]